MPLSDVIRRSGASEPYPDAVAVKKAVQSLERRPLQFRLDAAGTEENVAPFDGSAVALFLAANAALVAGNVTVRVNGIPVAGLQVNIAGGEAAGTRLSDNTITGDGTEKFRKGDRISVVVTGANNVRGFVELLQDA